MKRFAVALVILLLAGPACSSAGSLSPTPAPTAKSLALPQPTSTAAAPKPTALPVTPKPTALRVAPKPTARPSTAAAPTAPAISARALDASGPWGVIQAEEGLWEFNADGSGLSLVAFPQPVIASSSLRDAISPKGLLALVTSSDPVNWKDLSLTVLALPGGAVRTTVPLMPKTDIAPSNLGDPLFEAARAIVEQPSVAWSPDGSQVAFIGAQNGVSADLYVYSTVTGKVTRLTDGPSQAYQPSWSPDGKYIFQTGVTGFGTGAGYAMAGVWAARADGSGVKSLYIPKSSSEELVGWVGPHTFVVNSWSAFCGPFNLRTFDIETSKVQVLWPECFTQRAFDPVSGAILLSVDKYTAQANSNQQGGIFIVSPGQASPLHIQDNTDVHMQWSPEGGVFLVSQQSGLMTVQPDGQTKQFESIQSLPIIAPDGQTWAWSGANAQPGLWVWNSQSGEPARQIFGADSGVLSWSPDGQSLFFFGDQGLLVARAPDFVPALVSAKVSSTSGQNVDWVP